MSETVKFWVQTLIIPIVLAYSGYRINNTLQEKQRSFDKIKFADQVLNEAFDANNADKALALAVLIPQIVEDPVFADTLVSLINRHYFSVAKKALQSGNDTLFTQISDAAKTYPLGVLSDTLNKSPVTANAEKAASLETKGLQQIQQGNLKEAQLSFEKADKVYPGFHSTYEISNLLKSKITEVAQGADSTNAKHEVMEAVKKNYSWKLPGVDRQKN